MQFVDLSRETTDALAQLILDGLSEYNVSHGMPAVHNVTVGPLKAQLIFEDGTSVWITTEED